LGLKINENGEKWTLRHSATAADAEALDLTHETTGK